MNRLIKLTLCIFALFVFAYVGSLSSVVSADSSKGVPHLVDLETFVLIKTKEGDVHRFDVELATTREKQEQGLMHRKDLPEGDGMLFVWRMVKERKFWMFNTYIPLDIIFIAEDGRIQHIHPMAQPLDRSFITSGKPVRGVLEINGGLSDKLGISAGDYVHHSAFKNEHLLDR